MQLSQALAQLNQNRLLQQQQLEERRAYVLSQLPTLYLLMQQIKETGLLQLKTSLHTPDDNKKLSALTQRLEQLKREEAVLLSQYPQYAAMLEPQYTCSFCKDTGYDQNGQLCACIKNMLYQTDIDPAVTFENYNISIFPVFEITEDKLTTRELMKNYRHIAEVFCDNFPNNQKPNLFLNGKTGLGKTYLLYCIANRIKQKGHSVCYFTAYSLLERLRKYAYEDEPINDILSCSLLIIDDLGTEYIYKKATVELLYIVINHRLTRRLSICTATNMSINDLNEAYGDRIVSRLLFKPNTELLRFLGKDLRVL
ncbi:MAG: ATP-binding protein [Christensenellales bacterium]